MLAFLSVWIGLFSLILAGAMCVYRPLFTDVTIVLVVYFGSPGALCLAGLVLWAYRKEGVEDEGINAQCLQARVGLVLGLLSAGLVYGLFTFAEPIARGAP